MLPVASSSCTFSVVTLIIGHRGAPTLARENTVEAFEAARRVGADMVELDVRRAADGALVVHHDAALGDGRVIAQLPGRELPDWVPSLADALAACGGMQVNVEIKDAASPTVADEIDRVGWGDRVLVSSFNLATIDAIRGRLPTGWLTVSNTTVDVAVGTTAEHGHAAVHPHDSSVTPDFVDRAHAAGLAVNAWTIDDPARIEQLAAWGVDGIVTNDVELAVRLLRA